ncbi:MAG: AAA family ATPase [Anaerolineae bacterium]|nr:AAA family ATPase [Anaerolineae bacterium]
MSDTQHAIRDTQLNIVAGFYNYADVQALERYLAGSGVTILSAVQDAQRAFDDAINLEADAVLLCPQVTGYRHQMVMDLLLHVERPIPTVGLVEATSDDGRAMVANGAKGFVTLPLDEVQGAKVVTLLRAAVDEAGKERQAGQVKARAVPSSRLQAWQEKVVTIWVPKGGGSTRTTLAVNLAVALSHASLGNQPVCLLDFDMAKGDAHTMLGFTANPDHARRRGWPLLERGLFDLVTWTASRWGQQGEGAITPVMLRNYTVRWGEDSQLDLLPGLYAPHQADAREFDNRQMVYQMGRRIVEVVRQMYAFVIIDVGQDFTRPLHRAALEAANEVLVTVPPTWTAVVDAANAMPPLKHRFGDLSKFKLVLTRYSPDFGLSEKEIIQEVGLTRLVTIPHDAVVAETSINTHTPFVLTDEGPLGEAVRELAATYLPYLAEKRRRTSLFAGLRRALVREV